MMQKTNDGSKIYYIHSKNASQCTYEGLQSTIGKEIKCLKNVLDIDMKAKSKETWCVSRRSFRSESKYLHLDVLSLEREYALGLGSAKRRMENETVERKENGAMKTRKLV